MSSESTVAIKEEEPREAGDGVEVCKRDEPPSRDKIDNELIERVNELDISTEPSGNHTESGVRTFGTKLNESLSYLLSYGSSDDESSNERCDFFTNDQNEVHDESEESVFSLYSTDSEDLLNEAQGVEESTNETKQPKKPGLKNFYEGLDLPAPPIESLELNNREVFLHIGNVDCIMETVVTIEALPKTPSYNLETLLFLEEGKRVLGYVCDVVGPVSSPLYVVHFASNQEIEKLQLQRGTKVYLAPQSKYTKYVFVQELMQNKGSDASWEGDAEVPEELQEFSDDEKEREQRRRRGDTKRKHHNENQTRYRQFETNMNRINHLKTRLHRMIDTHDSLRQRIAQPRGGGPAPAPPAFDCGPRVDAAGVFDPTRPPPGYPGAAALPPVFPSVPAYGQGAPLQAAPWTQRIRPRFQPARPRLSQPYNQRNVPGPSDVRN